jgi:hypothetical protein
MLKEFRRWSVLTVLIAVTILWAFSACGGENAEQTGAEPKPDTAAKSIAERLTNQREAFKAKAPEEVRQVLAGALDSLRQSGLLESALNVGDTIPRFELSNAVGEPVAIADLLARGPVVLVFYRGNW